MGNLQRWIHGRYVQSMKRSDLKHEMVVPVNEPLLQGNEKKYLAECIDSGWISSDGPFVSQFENEFAGYVGRQYGVSVTSGTAALDIAFEAIGLSEGDEVIVPTFTIISCVHQICRCGAVPIFVDADEYSWNMETTDIESKITPRTKAILAVHIYGLSPDINKLIDICERYNLDLIEDFAEAIGQTFDGKQCGSFGRISIASFYPNKHISTGEGGMVLMDEKHIYEICKSLRNLCFSPEKRFFHEKLGWNYRMTNLQAAVGLAQLERIDEFVNRKRNIGNLYNENLDLNPELFQAPLKKTTHGENIYWVYGLVSRASDYPADRIMEELAKVNIGTRPFFYPLHLQPILNKDKTENHIGAYPNAERLSRFGFYIPCGLGISDAQIEYVCDNLNQLSKRIERGR